MEIKVGVVGATGYAGAELVRLLLNHPYAKLTAISSVTFEGQKISEVYPSYLGLCDMVCKTQEEVVEKCDVVFAALPHGLSQELAAACAKRMKFFIDLGADFRLEELGMAVNFLIKRCMSKLYMDCRNCSVHLSEEKA